MPRYPMFNSDGSISTEESITISDPRINNGMYTNIPTIFKGKRVPAEVAVEFIAKLKGIDPETGRKLPGFKTIKEAEKEARSRSESLAKQFEIFLKPSRQIF